MRLIPLIASLGLAILATSIQSSDAAKKAKVMCPEGKISCAEWCKKHLERTNCMTGHQNSCDQKPQGANACVGNN
ncbi:hypothetical protein ACVIGB_008803 [Bradyrhizobium sp. USDA 4341]|jgi:hypothetical protein